MENSPVPILENVPDIDDVRTMSDVLHTLADMGGTYAEAVDLIHQAGEYNGLSCAVAFDALPQAPSVYALAKKGALELFPGASRGMRLREMPELPGAGAVPDGVPVGVAVPVTRAAPAVLEAPGVPRGGPGPVTGAAPEAAALPEAARLDRVAPEPPGGGDGGGAVVARVVVGGGGGGGGGRGGGGGGAGGAMPGCRPAPKAQPSTVPAGGV